MLWKVTYSYKLIFKNIIKVVVFIGFIMEINDYVSLTRFRQKSGDRYFFQNTIDLLISLICWIYLFIALIYLSIYLFLLLKLMN